jgi:hypothetical protein
MRARIVAALALALVVSALVLPSRSAAIPAFARKYETSCLTCHSVYPRLTPFGEAFRRNGYRFPGVDSDYVKQGTVVLGQEANRKTFPKSVWPGTIPISSVLAVGANGQAAYYPKSNASVPRANNGVGYSFDDLVKEGHLWLGGSLDDSVSVWGELTVAAGGADVEHAQVLFNDLLGPQHSVNVVVGRGFPTLTSLGPHSSYLGDQRIPTIPVTGIYSTVGPTGTTPLSNDPFTLVDNYNGVELTGVLAGRFDYSAGVSSGKNGGVTTGTLLFNSENAYAHVGYKLGGMRLDGEGDKGPQDAMRPWAEKAVTLDAFVYHSREHFDNPTAPPPALGDTSFTIGGAARGQLGSLELDAGIYAQRHDRATAGLASVRADVEWAELSYVVYPWLVPAIRVERLGLRPSDGPNVYDVHVMPGIAFLIRPNVKAVLVANFEAARGYPSDQSGGALAWSGGNADWGGFVAAGNDTTTLTSARNEFESVKLLFAWAM